MLASQNLVQIPAETLSRGVPTLFWWVSPGKVLICGQMFRFGQEMMSPMASDAVSIPLRPDSRLNHHDAAGILAGHASEALGTVVRLESLCGPKAVADDATKLLARDARGRALAVVLLSSTVDPLLVQRGSDRARAMRRHLGPALGSIILEPIDSGTLEGRTFVVTPYCRPISPSRVLGRLHRARLRPRVLDWLVQVAERTAAKTDAAETDARFLNPLAAITADNAVGPDLRRAATLACQDAASGAWTPRSVAMHGDLWRGNILSGIHHPAAPFGPLKLIDWPGATPTGYGIYDLVRMARSLGLPPDALRTQLERHRHALGCSLEQTPHHLVAALANLRLNLGHFPQARFARMADECLATIHQAIA